jgi:HEAT repeat protein
MKVRIAVLVILVLCSLVVVGLKVSGRRHLGYDGHTLNFWLAEIDSSYPVGEYDPGRSWQAQLDPKRAEAAEAIRHIGTNAIPQLVEWLNTPDQDSGVNKAFNYIVGRLHRSNIDFPLALQRKRRAALGLAALGPLAKPAIPDLNRALNDRQVSKQAGTALGSIGPDGWVVLTMALRSTNSFTIYSALLSLGSFHAAVPGTTDALIGIASNSRNAYRIYALSALAFIGRDPEKVIPVFISCLGSTNAQVRSYAAWEIGSFRSLASNAVPTLARLLQDSNPTVRMGASNALGQIKLPVGNQ